MDCDGSGDDVMKRAGAAGFTLIELMIVVVVIAILGAVAYPSYQDHTRKAKRAEGKTALLKAAQVQERVYSDRSTYVTDLAPLFGLTAGATVYSGENPGDSTAAYRITAAAGSCGDLAACVLITATPKTPTGAPDPAVDSDCGSLTITSNGVRCWSTSGVSSNTCTPNPANATKCKW
jgi:type IV pilus assembly protein PilE